MNALTLPRPTLAAAPEPLRPELLRHLPSIAVIGGIVLLFASVGSGLPTLQPGPGLGLEQAPGEPPLPKPASDPTALAPISPDEAALRNAALPVESGPNPAAAAFTLPADEVARMRSVDCLTAAIYYEAANEPIDGQRAVAQVVLNRVRHPHYPKSVCGVVFQGHMRTTGCQFSFTCDGSLRRTPMAGLWDRSRKVAQEALAGYVHRPVGWATHYHANYVFPYWAPSLAKVGQIGAHIFYRWDGGWGRPGAFAGRYAGAEPAIAWRGGFGQVPRTEALTTDTAAAVALPVDAREAVAAAAAIDAQKESPEAGTSFQRSIMRRYEVTTPDRARQLNSERAQVQGPAASTRWAISGERPAAAAAQRPLGKEDAPAQPVVLDGVRRRPAPAPANSSGDAK
jgi:spore germination cell wall hydrolase CwlJ-like protein